MNIKKYLRFASVIIGLIVVLLFAFKKHIDSLVYPKQTTMRLALSQTINNFDPAVVFSDDALTLISQTLDTLYQYHYLKRPYEIIPSLALELPEIKNNGKSYFIKIKPKQFYHHSGSFKDLREVVAEDFINQFKRLAFKPLNSPGASFFKNKIEGFLEFSNEVGQDWKKIKETRMSGLIAHDKYTLEIKLNKRDPNFLYYLAMPFTTPIPWELIEKTKNDLSQTLVGSGPYEYKGEKDGVYRFKKNIEYRQEYYPSVGDLYANTHNLVKSSSDALPFIDELEFKVIKSEKEIYSQFLDKKIDVANIPKDYLGDLLKKNPMTSDAIVSEDLSIKHFSKTTSRWLGLNMKTKAIGEDLNLRKAIAFAINRDRYVEKVSLNTNLKANSILNPSILGYKPTASLPYEYNEDLARSFFKKSKAYHSKDFKLILSTRGKDTPQVDEANLIREDLEKIGIHVVIEPLEFSDFLAKGRAGELELWIDNWIYDYPDAENIFQLLISKNSPGINKSGVSIKAIDDLYEKMAQEENKIKRYEYMYEIEKIVNENYPWIMLMYESSYIVHRPELKNFRRSYFIRNYLKYLKFE